MQIAAGRADVPRRLRGTAAKDSAVSSALMAVMEGISAGFIKPPHHSSLMPTSDETRFIKSLRLTMWRPEASDRRFASLTIAARSPPNFSEISRRHAWIEPMMSFRSSVVELDVIAHQILWSADDRNGHFTIPQDLLNKRHRPRVRKMRTVPCQHEVYAMPCGDGNMERINFCIPRQGGR